MKFHTARIQSLGLTHIAVMIVIGVEIIPAGPLVIQPAIVRSRNSCIRSGDHDGNDGKSKGEHRRVSLEPIGESISVIL